MWHPFEDVGIRYEVKFIFFSNKGISLTFFNLRKQKYSKVNPTVIPRMTDFQLFRSRRSVFFVFTDKDERTDERKCLPQP